MKKMNRMLAVLLVLCMLLSMAACGNTAQSPNLGGPEKAPSGEQTLSRGDMELILDLMGDGQSTDDMTDEELQEAVDQLIQNTTQQEASGVINLGGTKDEPSVDVSENSGVYDENGAMQEPFDQVYPELIEDGSVAFSGESILVKLNSGKLTDGLKAAGVGALERIVPMEGCAWYEAKLIEGTDAQKALEAVRQLDEVLLAEYNYEIKTAELDHWKDFDDHHKEEFDRNEHNKDQWHQHHCGIPDGYEEMQTEGGDSSVIVAVIDTGVDYNHEDLKDNMWVNAKEIPDNNLDDDGNGYVDDYYGVDIIAGKGNGNDTNGHGTHVAGIIAARNNNVGVVGIAYNVKIMSVKAANHSGILHQSDIAKAVLYAYENGAEVINMSFGGTACSIAVQDALATAYTRCVLVASAGNSGAPNQGMYAIPNYPAALTYVLGVMSVDQNGVESGFTNYDVAAFNGVEYELYAPGESIMSTLPGDRYGYLSGTSMAAPIVSAMAAILRSEFSDRDMYPTKFIYGQLASTSGYNATCLDPENHGLHNLPQIVDLHAALTQMPKPEVSYQDYRLFDDPKYSEKNNGDGIIDAGETFALGFTLRNRWGMSENTLVTIDTKASATGLEDPYITIHNPTVDYGSVGTYSTQDCGKVWTDELWTGWEEPFLITVSEDCPNDYEFRVNISITCENALDAEDAAVYASSATLLEAVRAGFVLPSIIEEDMVLTPDNLYIVTNATIIQEGVTVKVMPGTHIQFWADDPNDTYAATYIPFLLVNGNFIVEGTKEAPVYIYPSQLMDRYGVEIGASSDGKVSMTYADITNFFYVNDHTGTGNRINYADHCTFRRNYTGNLYYRSVSGGNVYDSYNWSGNMGNITAKDCVFYKLANLNLEGSFDRCVFTECGLTYYDDNDYYYTPPTYTNCVFLGNSTVDQTKPSTYYNSSIMIRPVSLPTSSYMYTVYYREETGTSYVTISSTSTEYLTFLEAYTDLQYPVFETEEEFRWIQEHVTFYQYSTQFSHYFGAVYDEALGQMTYYDGTPIQDFVDPNGVRFQNRSVSLTGDSKTKAVLANAGYNSRMLFEVPGPILPTDITFHNYQAVLDLEATYQIRPLNTPTQLPADQFLYESTDEAVLTVSETGLVTPVGLGTADVWVYSMDRAVKNRMTFEVKDYVPLEDLTLPFAAAQLAIGERLSAKAALTPVDTTRTSVVYASSDERVAVVDENGEILGIGSGTAVITATCEGITAAVELTVYREATSLTVPQSVMPASTQQETAPLPQVLLSEGAETELVWRTTNPQVAEVTDGKLVLKTAGVCSLVVTDRRSGLSDSCLVMITEAALTQIKAVSGRFVLLSDGRLYACQTGTSPKLTLQATDVVAIHAYGESVLCAFSDGTVCRVYNGYQDYEVRVPGTASITKVAFDNSNGSEFFALTADGNLYAWGSNSGGQLGLGNTTDAQEPTLVNLDGVIDMVVDDRTSWFLTDTGALYYSGNGKMVPTLLQEGIKAMVYPSYSDCVCITETGEVIAFYCNGTQSNYSVDVSGAEKVVYDNARWWFIREGAVYGNHSYDSTRIEGIENAVDISRADNYCFVADANGMLYLVDAKGSYEVTPVISNAEENTVALTDDGLQEGVLLESSQLVLTFDQELVSAGAKLYADGVQQTVQCTIENYNQLRITRSAGLQAEVSYELVFESGTLFAQGGITNTQELRISFTCAMDTPETDTPETDVPDTEAAAPVIYEAIVDETVERYLTPESLAAQIEAAHKAQQLHPWFNGNAILNHISTDDVVEHWLRPIARSVSAGYYQEIPLGGNYWGTVNQKAIELQMTDYTDFITYARLMYAPFLTEAPENTFPFVTSVKLINKAGEEVTTVGNEEITFRVSFNRDMDTSIPLTFRFGSAYPYGDYEIEGQYVDERTWEGTYTLNTIIENGNQFITIENGCSATEDLPLQLDRGRFGFVIDTTAAQALIMQGTATDTGIQLTWTQDDFDTLMGYNVYRSTKEDGLYTRLNSTVIPADTMEWFDATVEPGVVYYYNFTVAKTDLTESEPSGKISIMSKDTMAPDIYHSPVANAFTGSNLVVSATVTDNLTIAYANLYYRTVGADSWKIIRMNSLNDKYSAIIPAGDITLAGVEYYIEAFDGVSYTYKASADAPYTIAVQEAVDANALGDVDGDGVITNRDALILLYAINDKYNLSTEEFARADLNGDGELWAAEALRILQYVSGVVGSVKM